MTLSTDSMTNLIGQFRGLNDRHPSQWPWMPTMTLFIVVIAVMLFAGWNFYWTTELAALDQSQQEEATLKNDYRQKIQKATSLTVLKQQKKLVSDYVGALEKQLPNKSEMEALLSDINQAGVGRGLQFELFKPGKDIARDYYIELPITIRVTGKYHEIGNFASDLAALPRIVSLQNLNITALVKPNDSNAGKRDARTRNQDKEKNKILTLDAVIKTYRYMESEEKSAAPGPTAGSTANTGAAATPAAGGKS